MIGRAILALIIASGVLASQEAPRVTSNRDSVVVRLQDVEVRTAIQALAPYLDRPVIVGNIPVLRVTIETPSPVPRAAVPRLLRELLDAHGLTLEQDAAATAYRVMVREQRVVPPPMLQPAPQTPQAGPELFVIRLKHAKATEVAATVNSLYGRASAFGELGERPTTLARQLQNQMVPPAPPPQAVTSTAGRVATLAGEAVIVPDSRANSLLIRASRADFDLIQAAVNELDVRPLQVLIEVLIAEVRRDRVLDIGVETTLPKTTIAHTENTTIEGKVSGGTGLGDFVVKVMRISGLDIDATIRAAESRGDARIVNRPVLLAANNERAEINVGSQRPFVQVARILPTDNTARDQVIQYRDVGTRLVIVPTISFEGYVMLHVVQEINAATAEQQFNAPVISTRSVETRLLVRDSHTIVLGGLSDIQRETVKSGIPLLSRLPLIGALFGRQSRQRAETELLLFLTPRLVRDDADAEAITGPLRRRAARIQK